MRTADADIPLAVVSKPAEKPNSTLVTTETLARQDHYMLTAKGVDQAWDIAPSPLALVLSVVIGSR